MSVAGIALVAFCALCLAGLGHYTWRRRRVRGAWPLALLAFSLSAFLALTLARELAPAAQHALWSSLRAVCGTAAPVLTVLFVLEACRREALARRLRFAALAWPAFNALLALRAVLYGTLALPPPGQAGTGDLLLDLSSGVAGLLMSGAALLLLSAHAVRSRGRERRQAAWYVGAMAVGAVGPVLDGFVLFTGLGQLTAVTWLAECALFGYTIHRFGVLGALPVALERVLREIHLGLVVVDGDARVVAANVAALHALGLVRGAVRGRRLAELGDAAARLALLQPGAETATLVWLVEGRQAVFQVRCARVGARAMQRAARVYLLADVSVRIRAEQLLQQSTVDLDRLVEEQTRALARMAADLAGENLELERINVLLADAQRVARLGSWTRDREGNRLRVSQEMQLLFGLDGLDPDCGLEEILARVHPEDRDAVRAAATEPGTGEPRAPLRVRVPLEGGDLRWIQLHASRAIERDAAGTARQVLGTAQDISAAHETEQRLARHGEELERRVAARSRELVALSREFDELNRLTVDALAPVLDRIDALVASLAAREAGAPPGFHAELQRIAAAATRTRAVAQEARARADAAVLPVHDR